MPKKLDVVELNKKEEKILLEERPKALILFFRKYGKLLLLLLILLVLIGIYPITYLFINGINKSLDITQVELDVTGLDLSDVTITDAASVEPISHASCIVFP